MMSREQPQTHHESSLVTFDEDLSPVERLFELEPDQYAYIRFDRRGYQNEYVADGIVMTTPDELTENTSETTFSLQGLDGKVTTIYIERLAETVVTVTKITNDTLEFELKPFPGPDEYIVNEILSVSAHYNAPQPEEFEISVRPAP